MSGRQKKGRKTGKARREENPTLDAIPPQVLESPIHPIFDNELIVKEILSSLRFKDILQCSLVSRQWNCLARDVLRVSGRCFAAIRNIAGRRKWDVIKLSSLVRNVVNSPFSGLSVYVYKRAVRSSWCGRSHTRIDTDAEDEPSDEDDTIEGNESQDLDDEGIFDEDPDAFLSPSEAEVTAPLTQQASNALASILEKLKPSMKYLKLTSQPMPRAGSLTESSSVQFLQPSWQNWRLTELILKTLAPSLVSILVDLSYHDRSGTAYTIVRNFDLELESLLPNLRTLELFPNDPCITLEQHGVLVMKLLAAAPNLQHLPLDIPPFLLNDLMVSNRTHLIKRLDFQPSLEDLNIMTKFALQEPKLRKLQFSFEIPTDEDENYYTDRIDSWPLGDQQKVRQTLHALLQSSRDTLETLSVDHLDLLLILTQWGDLPTVNHIKRLDLFYNYTLDKMTYGSSTLELINFPEYFPQLNEVSLIDTPNTREWPLEAYVSDEFKKQAPIFRCLTVTKLRYKLEKAVSAWKLNLYKRLFPNVKDLHLELNEKHKPSFPQKLWTLWPDLEDLSITALRIDYDNYNMSFLGISKEDADRMFRNEIEDSQLFQLESVRRGPSANANHVSNVELQRLSFGLIHGNPMEDYPGAAPRQRLMVQSYFLSSAALRLIRSRMPGLVIDLERELCCGGRSHHHPCHSLLKHLEPYVESLSCVQRPCSASLISNFK